MACTQEKPKSTSIDLSDLDTTVNPAADFDNYANGGWKKRLPIPDEKSRFGSFDLLADSGELQVQTLKSPQRPRWKRVQESTNNALNEAIGQIYVQKYFPAEAKKRMLDLVASLKVSLGERINQLEWMGDPTKVKAIEKLDAINVKIGYPDKWRDYSALEVSTQSFVSNVLQANNFDFNYMIGKVNKPVDRAEWQMPPQMVNAYYNPTMNEADRAVIW